jgi:hypothetical protein|uniref:Uncharacterized protein n=1 Tax=Populus trichocarpa TaxID=3694 RepID=A0A2K2BPZ3_POPTR
MLPIEHAINLFLEMGHLYHGKQKLTQIITLQKILSSIGKRTKRIPILARAVKRNSVKINMHTCITIYKLNSL